jgi:flagellar motility protein MotE (MotC chaperone)
MNPKNTAQIIVQIKEPIAINTMSKLSVEKLAKVMNSMEPAKSSRLSMLMAGVRLKNERVPGSTAGGKKP